MSSHSQFKRFNILQQLEQAIKKKTHQKYKSKSKSKPIQLKPARTPVLDKQSVGVTVTRKSNQVINQPPPPTVKSKQIDFKVKKYQNKKFDKIVSLINYTITSADKALKYVSLSSNFEAEFAFKLYLSDRQNLMNELNNLNFQQIINSMNPNSVMQPLQMKALQSNQNSNIQIHSLKNQNDKLKKQIMIMEGEIKKYKHREHEQKSNASSPIMGKVDLQKEDLLKRQIDVKQIHVNKLSDLLKRLCNFNEVYDYLDLVDKEMKYRSALASAGLSGFELNKIQREQFERNIVSLNGRIGDLEGQMIGKMEKMAQGQDEEVLQELEAINKLLHRKIAPILKENQSQSLENKKISEIISMYVNYSVKRERDLSSSLEKMEGKLIDYIQMAKDFEKKDMSTEQRFEQLYKENQLVKTNLKDIYEELKALLGDSLRKSRISQNQDITFETLLKQIEISLMRNSQLRGMEKKLKELSQEDNRKNGLIMKQNSIIQNMEYEVNEMKMHLKDSQDRKKQVQEYVLLLQKKKKQQSKQYEQMRAKFQNFAAQMQQSETLLYQKQTIIKRLEQQIQYTKVDIHKLSSLVRSKQQQLQEREDLIHEKEVRIEKLVAENNIHREQAVQIKLRLDQEVHDKNKILQHMRFLEDRLKEAENHIEAISEESSDKIKELNQQLKNANNSVKQAHNQKQHFEIMYQNLLQTRESQDQRKMGNLKLIQQEIQELRHQNHSYKQQITTLSHELNSATTKAQCQQQTLVESHEVEKLQLMSKINQMREEIQELKELRQKVHESNHMQLMQQNISSQEDIVEDINHKEEQIIQLKRIIQELEGEIQEKQAEIQQQQAKIQQNQAEIDEKHKIIEEIQAQSLVKQNLILQLQGRIDSYIIKTELLQTTLQSALTQSFQTKAKNAVLQQKLVQLKEQLIEKSPSKSHNDSLPYQQQVRIQQMQQKLNQATAQLDMKQQQAQRLKNQLSSKQSQFIQLQLKVTQIQAMFEQKQSQLLNRQAQQQAKYAQLEEKYSQIQKRQAQLQARSAQVEVKQNQVQEKLDQLQERLTHLQERQTKLQAKQQQLQADNNQLQTKVRRFQEKESELQLILSEHKLKTHQPSVKQQQLQEKHAQLNQRRLSLQQKQQQLEEKQQQLDSRLSQLHQRDSKLEQKQNYLQQRQNLLQQKQSHIQTLNQHLQPSKQLQQQQGHQDKEYFQQRCKQLQLLIERYKQQLHQRDQRLQQNHILLQQNYHKITYLNQQILQLSDTLQAERLTSQSLSFHISTNQKTIHQLQQKVQTLEVAHDEKDATIQLLNQKMQQLYVEIVDLKKNSPQKIAGFKQQKSQDLMMGVESSIKENKFDDSPIGDLKGISAKKIQLSQQINQQENVDNQQQQEQLQQNEEVQSPVERFQDQPQEQAEDQQEKQGQEQADESDLLKEGSNSESQKKSDNWLSADEVDKRVESQVHQVVKNQFNQTEQYQASSIEIIEIKYKRLINELKSQVEQKEQSISHVRQSHELLENQNNELISHIKLIERTKLQMENQLVGLREIAIQRMEQNDRLNDQMIRVKEEGEENTKRLIKEIQSYEEVHIRPLRVRVQKKDEEINELNEKYKQLQNTLQQTKRTKQEYIQALQNQSSLKQKQFQKKLQQLRTQMDQSRINLMKYQQEHQSLVWQNIQLRQKLQAQQNQSIQSNSKALVSLNTQLAILRQENSLIQTRYSTYELKVQIKIRQLRSEVIRLTTEVRMKEDEIQSLRKQLEEQQFFQQNFKSQSSSILDKNNEQIGHLKQQVQQANDKLLRNSIMLENAQKKITLLQQQLTIATATTNQKNTQLNQLQSMIDQLKYTNHSLSQSVAELNSELQKKQLQIQHMKISQQIQTYQSNTFVQRNYQPQQQNQSQQYDQQRKYNPKQLQQQEEENGQGSNNFEDKNAQGNKLQEENAQHNLQEENGQRNNLEEFDDMRSEKMNESMMSNPPQSQVVPTRVNDQNEFHEKRYENLLYKELPSETQHHETQTNQQQQSLTTLAQTYHAQTHHTKIETIQATEQTSQHTYHQFTQQQYFSQEQHFVHEQHYTREQHFTQEQHFTHQQLFEQQVKKFQRGNIQSSKQEQQIVSKEDQFFDEFDDMKSQKMNASMVSNDATQQRGQYYQQQADIIQQQYLTLNTQQTPHSQSLQSPSNPQQHQDQQQQEKQHQDKKHQQQYIQDQQPQQEAQNQAAGQDFDEFNDMKSQKMNQSMISNEPQPTQTKQHYQNQYQDVSIQDQQQNFEERLKSHKNLVNPNEDRQHSQGSYEDKTAMKKEVSKYLKNKYELSSPQKQHNQFVQIQHHERYSQKAENQVDHHQEELQKEQQQQKLGDEQDRSEGQQQDDQDLDQFNEMQSQKMNQSMMSNEPQPTEHRELFTELRQVTQNQNIVSLHQDREHSEGSVDEKISQKDQSQLHFKSQKKIPNPLNEQNEEAKEKKQEGQDFDEFNDMKSQKMNQSMMSNDPQSTEHQDNPVEERVYQINTRLANHPEEPEQKQTDLDDFNEMGQQKMNESMMSNQPEPTETQPLSLPVTIQHHRNIVDPHEDHQHSQGSSVHKYEINQDDKDIDIDPEQQLEVAQTHSEKVPYHQEANQQQKQHQQQQDFDQFNDMKSEKMNESMMSNEPQPSQHPDYIYHQVEQKHKNIVKANEDIQHSEGENINQLQNQNIYEVQIEEKEHPKSVQYMEIAHKQFINQGQEIPESHHKEEIGQQKEYYEGQKEQNGQNQGEPDFEEFNDMKSQQMNASMMSNDFEPIENRDQQEVQGDNLVDVDEGKQGFEKYEQDYKNDDAQDKRQQQDKNPRVNNILSKENNEASSHKEEQYEQPASKEQQPDLDQFDQMKSEKMNQSMMSNQAQPTQNQNQYMQYELRSDQQKHQPLQQKHQATQQKQQLQQSKKDLEQGEKQLEQSRNDQKDQEVNVQQAFVGQEQTQIKQQQQKIQSESPQQSEADQQQYQQQQGANHHHLSQQLLQQRQNILPQNQQVITQVQQQADIQPTQINKRQQEYEEEQQEYNQQQMQDYEPEGLNSSRLQKEAIELDDSQDASGRQKYKSRNSLALYNQQNLTIAQMDIMKNSKQQIQLESPQLQTQQQQPQQYNQEDQGEYQTYQQRRQTNLNNHIHHNYHQNQEKDSQKQQLLVDHKQYNHNQHPQQGNQSEQQGNQRLQSVNQHLQQLNLLEQEGNGFDAFNDMASEKMNDSMMSNNNQLNTVPQLDAQKLDISLKNNDEPQFNPINYRQDQQLPPQQADQNNFSNFNDMPSQNMGDSMISNQDHQIVTMQNDQLLTQLIENSSLKQQQIVQQSVIQRTVISSSPQKDVNLDEIQENKSQNQEDQGNFSNFMEMPNEQMSSSMISNHQQQTHSLQTQQVTLQILESTNKLVSIHKNQTPIQTSPNEEQFDQNNFSDFNDMASQKMGQSMMSNRQELEDNAKVQQVLPFTSNLQYIQQPINNPDQQDQSNDQNNFSDFNDMASQKMGDSMISNNNIELKYQKTLDQEQQQQKPISPIKDKSPQKYQLDEGNDFEVFNSMVQQKMDGSMVSNNQDKNIAWFDHDNKNTQPKQQAQEQGFSDFKDYNSEHMSNSQVSAHGQQIQPANFQPQTNALRLNNFAEKEQKLQDLLEIEKVLPSDILLTNERKVEAHYQTNHDDEEEDFNALINFLPQSQRKKSKTQGQNQPTQEQGMDTNRSHSFNQDDFEFKVRKSVQSIGSRADIFENFQNPIGSKISSEGSELKSNQMIKSAKRIENAKGKANDLFGFDDIMEQEHESSQHSSNYQRQNDDDFGDFLGKGNEPAPSPVNKKNEAKDFFDFDKMVDNSGSKSQSKKFNPFDDFE